MERHELTADQAFQPLAHVSRQADVTVRAVADHLVRTGDLPRSWRRRHRGPGVDRPAPPRGHQVPGARVGALDRVVRPQAHPDPDPAPGTGGAGVQTPGAAASSRSRLRPPAGRRPPR